MAEQTGAEAMSKIRLGCWTFFEYRTVSQRQAAPTTSDTRHSQAGDIDEFGGYLSGPDITVQSVPVPVVKPHQSQTSTHISLLCAFALFQIAGTSLVVVV